MSNVPVKEEVMQSKDQTQESSQEVENNDISKVQTETRTEEKTETKICPTCKSENGIDDKFCLSCGRALF